MNESYLSMYDITDQAKITEGQLESTLLKLKENEDLIKRMEAIEIAQAEEFSKLREELSSLDKQIKSLVSDKADLVEEVANFEAKAWVVEEYLKEAVFARDTEIVEAAEEAKKEEMVKFKDSEEFATFLEEKREAGCEEGYDVRVADIWLKHWDIDYGFLGEEFMKLMDQWLKNKMLGDLNNAPPSSHLAPVTEGNIIATKVGPFMVSEQQLPVDLEEGEVVASNPPPTVEEPMNKVTSGFIGNHDLIILEKKEEPAATVDNDPPT